MAMAKGEVCVQAMIADGVLGAMECVGVMVVVEMFGG